MGYLNRLTNPSKIPQKRPLTKKQVKNDAGGFVFKIDKWSQLRRFLILGSEGNSYYVNEAKKFDRSIKCLEACLAENGLRVIQEAVEISDQGRAPKNDQAIFALAAASMHDQMHVRRMAFEALPKVCRIGTHLYQFIDFRKNLGGGWGRLMRDYVGDWFNLKDPERLSLQVAKYPQREGWSARDVLRKAHPMASTPAHNAIYHWVTKGIQLETLPEFLKVVDEVKTLKADSTADVKIAVRLITEHRLPREVLPTEMLSKPKIWEAMLQNMPMTAAIRNLGKMSNIGILGPGSNNARQLAKQLKDEERIKKARIHPINVLMAKAVYANGRGVKGSLMWKPNRTVLDALEDAFYLAFGNVEPTGKRTMLALDVSGSMFGGSNSVLTPREITAAMAMVTLRTEQEDSIITAFADRFIELPLSAKYSLETVLKKISNLPFGRTDCGVPMLAATKHKMEIDTFVIYTDNETWCGSVHPVQALKEYRQKMGIDAKLIVCATEASPFSIADPDDPGMLDIAGFDAATPRIISEFSKGNI